VEVGWGDLEHNRVTRMLRNPRYAGAFFYGRTRRQKKIDGGWRKKPLSRQEWHTLIPDAHPGYITWQDYEENLRRLQENAGVGVIPPPAKTVSRGGAWHQSGFEVGAVYRVTPVSGSWTPAYYDFSGPTARLFFVAK
jgi:hypothetical protein